MTRNSKVFVNFYGRYTKSQNQIKGALFSERIHQAPIPLISVSMLLGLFLGRSRIVDMICSRMPMVKLFVRFLCGNAQLILKSPEHAPVTPSRQDFLSTETPFDLIVIGSGPGGSIAALRGAETGKRVLVIEAGEAYPPSSIEHHSLFQTVKQFRNGGLNFIWGTKPILFAEGMTLGGGSEVNSGLYHRLEGHRRTEILSTVGSSEEEWSELEKLVEKAISVQLSPEGTRPDHGLVLGAFREGLICKESPRWRKHEPFEEHQGMQVTYLQQAKKNGAKVLVNSQVNRLTPKKDCIEVEIRDTSGIKRIFKSEEVVLAAGTLETPRILHRSKLSSKSFPLNLHPMLRAVAAQDKVINDGDLFPSWQAWDTNHMYKFGYSVSTYPYLSATLRSLGEDRDFNDNELSHMAAYFSSFALSDSKAKLKRFGTTLIPAISFGKTDNESMKESSKQLIDLLRAGEATEFWPKKGISPVTTVHLFGSLPVGRSPLINDKGRLIKEPRIRISDGSLMPQAPWGNPQGAIMVLCELMAKRASHE
jgi:hypothetical protein